MKAKQIPDELLIKQQKLIYKLGKARIYLAENFDPFTQEVLEVYATIDEIIRFVDLHHLGEKHDK